MTVLKLKIYSVLNAYLNKYIFSLSRRICTCIFIVFCYHTLFLFLRNPTPQSSDLLQNITWPLIDTTGGDFLYVDINENLEIKNHPKEETYSKWVELYESLNYTDFDTY